MAAPKVFSVRPGSKQEAIQQAQKSLGTNAMATLTADQLKTKPGEPKGVPETSELSYTCITEIDPEQVASIVVGLDRTIPRWKPGSVINYATYADGYPNQEDAIYAANALIEAADSWNAVDFGVQFNWVPNLEDAAFVLAYGKDKGSVLASAYFPNAEPLNTVWVYSFAFDKEPRVGRDGVTKFKNYEIMKNVFQHELGHVLGLRHEFAIEREGAGAVRLFSKDPNSVMSYLFPPEIQESDKKDLRAFYGLPQLVDFVPDN
ncbi:hypothetical protein A1O7_03635 [Cladophialophora yegresii CBS 114405]|uniref:Peptidase metallopeptidase domain-containing protein n=1 Tax=Cladophialophora yegresii CBS 114405 TaxID=1182544 RepID=W9WY44_9EURO|nr:uncharacterized protein A1O7_03635 [Cladophialophora yegresii CBS 114405]EXJ63189.1 hypothetical protein A1O7_03635 [Cladophialophora yegresii CBS 114405]